MRSSENTINQVRPTSTFDSFEICEDGQLDIVSRLRRLAARISEMGPRIIKEAYPFPHGRLLSIYGNPGVGKTHLMEAVVNEWREVPGLLDRVFLDRDPFVYRHQCGAHDYEGRPIVLIDDLFSELQSVDQMHPNTDVRAFMDFIMMVYESRRLVIMNSNFPIISGVAKKVAEVDSVGRVKSRLSELLAGSGEINLPGQDFRQRIADSVSRDDGFFA